MNYSYLAISITQFILYIITIILFPYYIKNSSHYIFGNIPKKYKPLYYSGIFITFLSICYMIYYCSLEEISNKHDITNKLLFSLYIFLSSLWAIFMIFYNSSKNKYIYHSIQAIVILYALCSLGLLINVSVINPLKTEDKVAIAASFFIALLAIVGDAIYWLINFPKLK